MIQRSFDAAFFNEIANHPEVRPHVGGDGLLDLAPQVMNPANFSLVVDGGGFLLIAQGDGIYEVHSLFLPEARSRSIRAMRDGFDYMFTRTDCEKVVTQVPDNNPAAAALAKIARFRPMFRRDYTPRGPTAFVGLTIDEWAMDNAALEKDGEEFHAFLETSKVANGSDLVVHAHDAAHERAVGAAFRMIRAGNAAKAVRFYNRWAAFSGYALISLVSECPLAIDVVDAVVGFSGGELEMLLCR